MIKHKLIVNGTNTIDSTALTEFTLTETVNEGQDLTLGSVCSAMVEFSVRTDGIAIPQYGDKITLLESDGGDFAQHGIFYVETVKRVTDRVYKVTAYDAVSRLDKDITEWLQTVTFPISLYDLTSRAIQQCGISIANASIPNGDYQVKAFKASGITARNICHWAGEISARFCHATDDGKISFDWYTPSETDITEYYMGSFNRSDFKTGNIEKVQIQSNSDDIGTIFPDVTGEKNTYKITGNYLLTADSGTSLKPIAEYIYNQIKNVSYTPMSVTFPSDFRINVGNTVNVITPAGTSYVAYCMRKQQSGSRDTISCVGNKVRETSTAVNNQSFSRLSGKVLSIKTDVDGVSSTVTDLSNSVDSRFSQTATDISAKVSKSGGNSSFGWSLTDSDWTLKSNGKTVMQVNSDGAEIKGKVTAESGKIGGWSIGGAYGDGILSAYNKGLFTFLAPPGKLGNWVILAGGDGGGSIDYPFKVSEKGELFATNAHITGEITASTGKIGGIHITKWGFYTGAAGNYSAMQGSDVVGSKVFAAGVKDINGTWDAQFFVRNNGYIYAKNADIEGKITASSGKIGNWSINGLGWLVGYSTTDLATIVAAPDSKELGGNVIMAGGGKSTGYVYPFVVTQKGELYASKAHITGEITAKTGKIGGLNITDWGFYTGVAGNYTAVQGADVSDSKVFAAGVKDINGTWDAQFFVRSNGYVYAQNVDIKGKINATSGTFRGTVYASAGEFTGKVTSSSGKIGGWSISGTDLYGTGTHITPSYVAYRTGSGELKTTWDKIIRVANRYG